MVSFWPWKGHDSSPSSFEKTLSTLSDKITKTTTKLDKARSNSRRIKILWTLYLTFAYLVYAIVLTLVVGWQNLGPWEFTGMAGGPILIYLVRTFTNAYFSYRIDSLEARLKDHQAERAKTIQKLKDATKYDSTLELLEKYGGTGEKRNQPKKQEEVEEREDHGKGQQRKVSNTGSVPPSARINIPPPPTANIQRPPSRAPVLGPMQPRQDPSLMPRPHTPLDQQPTEEFAPNAGPLPISYAQYDMSPGPPRWYDRIMDLMLGEDETASKNRIVLICKKCRLVNGQAPPGTKSLTELGTWKCISCRSLNGEIDEGKKIIREVLESKKSNAGLRSEDRDSDISSDLVRVEHDNESTGNTDGEASGTEQRNLRHRNKKSQMVP
ncbi:uncharacterized protein F4807DRAFT_458318 [Annulohypoxylon truncatum]|uniref:uncharacterized protein n=1 Tax=Annulohypoxylon truncatum TaxID=327061 RepID=UPI0020084861|nr:uncharacterized protein F4807DRAFT_458318 [Annulohypoxylon truncatum]KAI1212116.1 hypothetical protein F4807DRAFT_458318 [Annulohypoxylon truncatum]